MSLTHIDTTNGNLKPNFIKEKYFSYKVGLGLTIKPEKQPFDKTPKLHIVHDKPKFRDAELHGQMDQKDNYLVTRPNMYWQNVGSTTDNTNLRIIPI